jgi:hypothetical protein
MQRLQVALALVGFFVIMGGLFVAANGGWW